MITASISDLMEQAPDTTSLYMNRAIDIIDSAFGKGYAQEHPELLSVFIMASANDFHIAAMLKVLEKNLGELIYSINSITEALGA